MLKLQSSILIFVFAFLMSACVSSRNNDADEPSYKQLQEVEQVLKDRDASVLFKRYPYALSRSFWRAVERGISSGSKRWLATVEDLLLAADDEASVGLRSSFAEALKVKPKLTLAFIWDLPAERVGDVSEICTAVAACQGKDCRQQEIKELEAREASIRRVITQVSKDESICLATITRRINQLVK